MMSEEETQSVIYKIFKLLRQNALKILMTIREEGKIRWKELQELTGLSTATFNRALAALQEVNFIKKENNVYTLTWTGKLVTDGLILFGWRMAEEMDEVEDAVAEELLAKDMVMVMIFLLFVSLKRRGKLNMKSFEKELKNEMDVMNEIFRAYEEEGYIEIRDGWIYATEKMSEMDISSLFS